MGMWPVVCRLSAVAPTVARREPALPSAFARTHAPITVHPPCLHARVSATPSLISCRPRCRSPDPSILDFDDFRSCFHHALLELHVEKGTFVCPETGRHFPINKGVPNMLLNEE